MRKIAIVLTALAIPILGAARAPAQGLEHSIDRVNLQFHGYATQGFIYTTNNNWDTTDSTDGSPAWTEAVVNVTAKPWSRLHFGAQARYLWLGKLDNKVTWDWAEGDFKLNEFFGVRAGKVKVPQTMLNDSQDIDPAHLWVLLPQSIYPLASRNSNLAVDGGLGYGAVPLGERMGKLEYRVYGGERVIASDDSSLYEFTAAGFQIPNGMKGRAFGGTLRWNLPIAGTMVGASIDSDNPAGTFIYGPLQGKGGGVNPVCTYAFFGRYEHGKWMAASEYSRVAPHGSILLTGFPPIYFSIDQRMFYVMASYKLAAKLTTGAYYSSTLDRQAPISSARFQKDWTVSARYDFNSYLYLKAEQHWIDGTEVGYSTSDNTALKPSSRMTLLKVGVTF